MLTVLYDDDCGFCRRTADLLRYADRDGRIRLVPLQTAAGVLAGTPRLERLLETMHVVDGTGRYAFGGAAWLAVADAVPALRPIAVIGRLPVVGRLVEPGYTFVSGQRHRISRMLGLDSCRHEPAP